MNMKGDFSRITFDPSKNFTSVLMQQGRVQLDADWNEQAAILLWQIRALARGIIGEFGAVGTGSFEVTQNGKSDLQVGKGTYFVHGIAVENMAAAPVPIPVETESADANTGTPALRNEGTAPPRDATAAPSFDVFLAVRERLVTWFDDPSIREVALGDGIDTAVRSQVRWSIVVRPQVKDGVRDESKLPVLKVSLDGGDKPTDACTISPDARYRGAGNQLYRVEIHNAWKNVKEGTAFKWSRENASLVFPVLKLDGTTLHLHTIGRDDRLSIHPGDYLEFESTDIPWDKALPLALVQSVSADKSTVTVDKVPDSFKVVKDEKTGKDNLAAVRRWDHSQQNSGGLTEVSENKAVPLENGLSVTFQTAAAEQCRRGDYWLVPARTGVDWAPPSEGLPANRLEHFLAPLASFAMDALGNVGNLKDERSVIQPLAKHV